MGSIPDMQHNCQYLFISKIIQEAKKKYTRSKGGMQPKVETGHSASRMKACCRIDASQALALPRRSQRDRQGTVRRGAEAGRRITEVSYMFAKPGPDPTPVPKVAFIARAGDLYCGVG